MLRYGAQSLNSPQIYSKTNTIFAYNEFKRLKRVNMIQKRALPFKIPKTTKATLILQEDYEPYFYDKLHQHEENQLTLILNGYGTVVHGDYVGSFKSGDVFLMGSNVPHVFRCDDSFYEESKKAHSISIFFNDHQLSTLLNVFPEFDGIRVFLEKAKLGGKADDDLNPELSKEIKELFSANEFDRLIHFFRLLDGLSRTKSWHPLMEHARKSIKEQEGKRLNDVFSHTLSNYQKAISIDEIAEVANMNKSSFCRYFKQHTRKSYIDFLNEYRIQKACNMLSDPDMSVAQLAFEVGFTNLSNFNRQFKKLMKETPREFRKKVVSL